jgi:hypothetical protein
LYGNYRQQQLQIKTTLPLLQSITNQLARSVDESLSLKLDYNRDGLRDIYIQETLVTVIQPVRVLQTGYAWMVAEENMYWGLENSPPVPLSSITAPNFLTALRTQTAGSGVFSWQEDEVQLLNAWAPVSIQGYDWMVGVSLPFDELKNTNDQDTQIKLQIGILSAASLLGLFLLIWNQVNHRQNHG